MSKQRPSSMWWSRCRLGRERCPWGNAWQRNCKTFRCSTCKRYVPWCQGTSEDNRCDRCAVKRAKGKSR